MCSCMFKSGKVQTLTGFDDFIPQQDFVDGKTNMLFRFWFCVDKSSGGQKINKALEGFYITEGDPLIVQKESDMDSLAQMSDSGKDMEVFKKSIKNALASIRFTQKELDEASCKVAFATGQ